MLKCLICFIYLYLYYMCLYFPPYLCCCICIVQKPSIIYILWCSSDSSYMSNSYLYLFCMHLYFSLRFLSYLCCWACIVYNRSPETAEFNWIHRTSSVSYHWMCQLYYWFTNLCFNNVKLTCIVMFKCQIFSFHGSGFWSLMIWRFKCQNKFASFNLQILANIHEFRSGSYLHSGTSDEDNSPGQLLRKWWFEFVFQSSFKPLHSWEFSHCKIVTCLQVHPIWVNMVPITRPRGNFHAPLQPAPPPLSTDQTYIGFKAQKFEFAIQWSPLHVAPYCEEPFGQLNAQVF